MKKLCFLSAIAILLASCGKMQEPQFKRLANFNVKKVGLNETTIGFNATFYNPNSFGVNIKEAAFDVYIDSAFLGNFKQPQPISVNSKADFSLPMEGNISLGKALNLDLPGLIGKEVSIKAAGQVKIGKAGVYVTKPFTYQGKQKLTPELLKNGAGSGL